MSCIELLIRSRPRDIGDSFHVRRSLPSAQRRLVGPFIFFDHFGPVVVPPGRGMDVRPHPHVCLATVTYLFEGEIVHRDSLGTHQIIRPGEVNWMKAGRGIVHSERSGDETRARGQRMHGLQLWLALPTADEESEPAFRHYDAVPSAKLPGTDVRVVIGSAFGVTSPVEVSSPTLYVEAKLDAGAELAIPDEHAERAAYVVSGVVTVDGDGFDTGTMIIFREGAAAKLVARKPAHVMLLGGAPIDGERHIYWNFVASSKDRIEQAKRDWREGRFPKVPGDEVDFIPLPDAKHPET